MKKLLTILAAGAWLGAAAFVPGEVTPVTGITGAAHHPVLSPDGNTLLFSTLDHTGLQALDMASGTVTPIDRGAAAGFAPVFSNDGKTIIYRTAATDGGLLVRDLKSFDLSTGHADQLQPMSRNDVDMQAAAGKSTYALSGYNVITVCRDGAMQNISPVPDAHSYLWPSVSPDGKRLLFNEPFKGVFVCNLDGSNLQRVARRGDYPAWADDNTIIYIVSADDGYVTTSSQLVAQDIRNNDARKITADNIMVDEATAASGRVVFSTADGNLFQITLN